MNRGDIIQNEIYLWLSMIKGLHYYIFLRLLKAFNSIENIYVFSNDQIKFKNILNQNNIKIQNEILLNLYNKNLKEYTKSYFNILNNKNIELIPMFSKKYPLELYNVSNPPYCILAYGNLSLIGSNQKKVYAYNAKYFTNDAKSIHNNSIYTLNKKHINVFYDENTKANGIYIINSSIKNIDILKLSDKNLYVFEQNKNTCFEILASITDACVIAEARYEKDICMLTDILLEFGKEILVFPGSIYNKNCYFSNYLIKQGASVITNVKQLYNM